MLTQIMASWPPLSYKKKSLIDQKVSSIVKNLDTVYPVLVKYHQILPSPTVWARPHRVSGASKQF